MKLILGSGSPRRLELLAQLGLQPHAVRPPDVDETPLSGELPRRYCERITGAKLAASQVRDDEAVLCADTTVALGRRIMGKPRHQSEAAAYLRLLSGRRHRVFTVVGVKTAERNWLRTVETSVKIKRLDETEIDGYLATGDWQGKAGGYAIQGPAGAFIPWIQGSYTGVIGLPLAETSGLLRAAGVQ